MNMKLAPRIFEMLSYICSIPIDCQVFVFIRQEKYGRGNKWIFDVPRHLIGILI